MEMEGRGWRQGGKERGKNWGSKFSIFRKENVFHFGENYFSPFVNYTSFHPLQTKQSKMEKPLSIKSLLPNQMLSKAKILPEYNLYTICHTASVLLSASIIQLQL